MPFLGERGVCMHACHSMTERRTPRRLRPGRRPETRMRQRGVSRRRRRLNLYVSPGVYKRSVRMDDDAWGEGEEQAPGMSRRRPRVGGFLLAW